MDQRIQLCLPSFCPGFKSLANQLCFYHFYQICVIFVFALNEKSKKRMGFAHLKESPFAAHLLYDVENTTRVVLYEFNRFLGT